VVLLHGLFDTHRGWRDLPQRLARRGSAVLVPDLPGHGESRLAARSVDEAAALTAQLVADDAPSGPLVLVGHSLGAALAVRLVALLGARVAQLVLIAPAGLGARINADFVDGMMAAQTPAALGRALAFLDAGPLGEAALTAELGHLKARRDDLAPLVAALAHAGLQQIDLRAEIARLACPVTVVFGTADRILDWQSVAELPASARIHLVRGAGHMPHASTPGLVADLVAGAFTAAQMRAIV
jgi:pyruvate dehydrogenase E2 component (dihydrolipoamide acetyltransferase)